MVVRCWTPVVVVGSQLTRFSVHISNHLPHTSPPAVLRITSPRPGIHCVIAL